MPVIQRNEVDRRIVGRGIQHVCHSYVRVKFFSHPRGGRGVPSFGLGTGQVTLRITRRNVILLGGGSGLLPLGTGRIGGVTIVKPGTYCGLVGSMGGAISPVYCKKKNDSEIRP